MNSTKEEKESQAHRRFSMLLKPEDVLKPSDLEEEDPADDDVEMQSMNPG